jgi:hypothetical protein
MPLYSIPRRPFRPEASEPAAVNWRRGLFRVWLLISAGWIMGWTIRLIMHALEGRFPGSDFLAVPVLLFGPPVALLIFAVVTGWAFRGFRLDDQSPERIDLPRVMSYGAGPRGAGSPE